MANYNNTSSAYELEDNDLQESRGQARPELKMLKSRRPVQMPVVNGGVVFAFLLVMTLVSMMIYNQAQLNMLSREMAALDKEMQALLSENVRMSSQLTSTNSDIELERMAIELGMQKRSEYQTKRIYLYAEDKITRAEIAEEPSGFEAAKLALMSLLSQFKEYPGAA
jgi:hypothetical protein